MKLTVFRYLTDVNILSKLPCRGSVSSEYGRTIAVHI